LPEHRILLVEDDATIRAGLRDALESEGYAVLEAPDGVKGLHRGLREDPDLIVLDLMLPGMDGYEVLRRLRGDAVQTPVLLLTARGLEADKVKGLALGADDYVVKPFGVAELLARIASRLRAWDRERGLASEQAFRFGEVVVDFAARTVRNGEGLVALTPKEFDLLALLVEHEGRAVPRAEILAAVWSDADDVVSRVVDTTVLGLRKKVEPDPAAPRHVLSVRGVGYRFTRVP
jgi:DNA-binding response OmpR family regulator